MTEYYRPEDPSATEAIISIGEDLDLFDDLNDERIYYIMDLRKKLPLFPNEWQDDAHRVQGCQANVWLAAHEENEKLYFTGTSDSVIVSGLVALILRVYSGRSRAEILSTSPQFLTDLGLIKTLSTNRGNGVAAMVERIQQMAKTSPAHS
jgi:cysteine desulfuration protein SufE